MFDITTLNLVFPEIFLVLVSLVLLIIGVVKGNNYTYNIGFASIFSLLLICFYYLNYYNQGQVSIWYDAFVTNKFIIFSKILLLIASIIIILMLIDIARKDRLNINFEFPIIILLSLLGMMIMVSSNNFLSLYMGLELQSLSLYILAAIARDNSKSSEAGIKYFVLGALSSGLLLYGVSLIYGYSGTISFVKLSEILNHDNVNIAIIIGMVFIISAICFKLSAVPFHMWTPDVYQGAPTIVTALFAILPKIAMLSLFIRLMLECFGDLITKWQQIIIFVSAASMIIGSLGAIKQTNIKRIFAYSSIGHVGFILMGLAAASEAGIKSIIIYLFIYMTMTAGGFACLLMIKQRNILRDELYYLSGLSKSNPVLAFCLAILMLSMAGVPPMAGFFAKFYVFSASLSAKLYWLSIIGIISSVVATYYYLKIIKVMYFDDVMEAIDNEAYKEIKVTMFVATLFNIIFFLAPTSLINSAEVIAGVIF